MINNQFDKKVNKVIGMKKQDAYEYLKENGYQMRITFEDGKSPMVKGDINMKRVNVFVNKGVVTNIDKIG